MLRLLVYVSGLLLNQICMLFFVYWVVLGVLQCKGVLVVGVGVEQLQGVVWCCYVVEQFNCFQCLQGVYYVDYWVDDFCGVVVVLWFIVFWLQVVIVVLFSGWGEYYQLIVEVYGVGGY